jgi:hypothetical protein
MLQGPQVVRVTKFGSQLFEDSNVPISALNSALTFDIKPDVAFHTVVVEQRVIYVKQEHNFGFSCHRLAA